MKRLSLSLAFGLTAVILSTSCKPKPVAPAAVAAATPDTSVATAAPDSSAPVAQNAPTQDGSMQRRGGGGGGNRGGRGGGGGGGGGNLQQRADQRMAQMKTTLGLTDDQAQKIRAVYDQQFGALRQQAGSMSQDDRRAAFEKARAAANAQIDQILTPDQKPKWEALQQQMQQRRGQGGGGGGGGRRFGGGGQGGGGNRGGN